MTMGLPTWRLKGRAFALPENKAAKEKRAAWLNPAPGWGYHLLVPPARFSNFIKRVWVNAATGLPAMYGIDSSYAWEGLRRYRQPMHSGWWPIHRFPNLAGRQKGDV
jgi:hypothetical protein